MGTVIQDTQQRNADRSPRWNRMRRAELFDQYLDLEAKGLSLRQAAKALEVPRSTLQAWRAYQESLDEHPALVLGIHPVCTEVGACGIRLVCLLVKLTGLDRFVAVSYGTQQQINRQVEEATVGTRHARQSHHVDEG